MRKINTSDIFAMSKLLKKIDAKEILLDAYEKGELTKDATEEEQKKLGIDFVFAILDKCSEEGVEDAFYEFFASICEKSADDIANQPITDTIEMFKQIAKENDLASFFEFAFKSSLKN